MRILKITLLNIYRVYHPKALISSMTNQDVLSWQPPLLKYHWLRYQQILEAFLLYPVFEI